MVSSLVVRLRRAVVSWSGALAVGAIVVSTSWAQEAAVPVPPPVAAAAPGVAAQNGPLGVVLVDRLQLRCWGTANSPLFEDTFSKGQVLAVGPGENGFRKVSLPLGPTGYVNKTYAQERADGQLVTKGRSVSFRYRPKGSELPVKQLADGVELHVLGEHEDWWKVRCPGVEAWVPEAEVQVFEQPDATQQAAWSELQRVHAGEAAAWTQKVAAAKAKQRQEQEHREMLDSLQNRFLQELRKPLKEQELQPIEIAAEQLSATVGPESPLATAIQALQKRIADQKWVVEATIVRNTEVAPAKDLPPMPPGEVRDELERFQAVGWLRYRRVLAGEGQFYIEKGGQELFLVTCKSGRYDLALFLDKEVGLIGPRRRPAAESLRVLEVEKIEILGRALP